MKQKGNMIYNNYKQIKTNQMKAIKTIIKEAMEDMKYPDVFFPTITYVKGKFIKVNLECGYSEDLRILKQFLTKEKYVILN